ncbi:MAG: tetratricopeptide repeat protein [Chloroflexi bacterium]|nr:tetratricopeptide repeat protein [Chloroflexota bacterium]
MNETFLESTRGFLEFQARSDMSQFGALLRKYRRRALNPDFGGILTQERLAELIGLELDNEELSGATISNWERGKHQVRLGDRRTLVALVKVLRQCGGIKIRAEADELLNAGDYRPLDDDEIEQIEPTWLREATGEAAAAPFPSAEEQEAALPPPTYSELFGVEGIINESLAILLPAKSPYVVALAGLGGSGKTAIADAVARRIIHQGAFDHVLWLEMESPVGTEPETSSEAASSTAFRAVLAGLSRRLFPQAAVPSALEKQVVQVRSELKRHRYLIIVNNLESVFSTQFPHAAEIANLLAQLNGLARPSKFLLTTRAYPPPEANVYVYPVRELARPDAIELLRYQVKAGGSPQLEQLSKEELDGLYQVAGGHPLALRLTARLAVTLSPAQIAAGWQAGLYSAIYDALWPILSPAEKQLLQVMPLVAHGGATPAQLQAISGLPEEQLLAALPRLVDYCLLEPRGTSDERRYGIHNLSEQFLHGRRDQHGNGWWADAVVANVAYWQRYLDQLPERELGKLDADRLNIFRAVQWSLALAPGHRSPAVKDDWLVIAEQMYRYVTRRGYGQEWLPLLEKLPAHYPDDVKARCRLLNLTGRIHRLLGQLPAAIELHERAHALAQRAEDELEIAQASFNLGTDYYRHGDNERALTYGQRALELFTRLGLAGRETAATLNLLGIIAQAQGDLATSEELLRRAVALWREFDQPADLVRSLNNLALTLEKQKRVGEAVQCYAEARKVLAGSASELDRTLIYLSEGTLYFNQDRLEEAEEVFRQIDLEYLMRAGHRPHLARALNNLGSVALRRDAYEEAESRFQESVALWRQLAEEIELANSLYGLGQTWRAKGRLAVAEATYYEALALLAHHPADGKAKRLRQKILEELKELDKQKG